MEEEKKEYKEKIIALINNCQRLDILIYLYLFISKKIKAE